MAMWGSSNLVFLTLFILFNSDFLWRSQFIKLNLILTPILMIAYTVVAALLLYFRLQWRDLSLNRFFLGLSAIMLSIGLSHVIITLTLWYPLYGLVSLIEVITIILLIIIGVLIVQTMPPLLKHFSPELQQQELEQRQQIEAELKNTQQLLRLILEASPQRVFWKDRHLNYLGCNQRFAEDAGLNSTDEIIGKNDFELAWCASAANYRHDDQDVINSGIAKINYKEPQTLTDGKVLWLKTSKFPLRNSTGEVFGVFGSYEAIHHSPEYLPQEPKPTEIELKESQQLLYPVIDNIPQFIFWKDRHSVYLGCNSKFARIVGLSNPEDIIGKTDYDLPWQPTQAAVYRQQDAQVMENDQPDLHRVEQRSQVDGSLIWVEINKVPLHDSEGNVIGILGSYEDITERRQVNEALRSSQQDLQTIFDNVYEAIIIHDLQGKILNVNQRMLKMFGVTEQQARQLSIEQDLSSPDNLPNELPKIWQAVLAGERQLFEWKARRPKDGHRFDVEVFLRKVKLNNQAVILANVRDITTRKQTELALKQQLQLAAFRGQIDSILTREEKLQNLLQACTDAVIEHLNGAFARIWLLNPTENQLELQASSGMYTHLDGAHGRIALGEYKIGRIAQNRQPHLVNNVLNDPQISHPEWAKREGMVAFAGYPLMLKERLVGVIALFARSQLSEKTLEALALAADEIAVGVCRKQAELALQQSEAQLRQRATQLQQTLEQLKQTQTQLIQSEKMSALGQMMAGIAHEINNPVSFIAGNLMPAATYLQDLIEHLQLYQKQFPHPGTTIEEHRELIDLDYLLVDFPSLMASLKIGVERIRGISTSMRIFSRSDQEKKILFNIEEGIESTLMILKHRLKANDFRPEIDVFQDYQKHSPVFCYPGQLNQVFMNIIANSIDAFDETNQDETLLKSGKNCCQIIIKTELDSSKTELLIRIRDNGPGIPTDLKNKVFDYLFTTKPVGKGTGLGLSISRQIIEQNHQGRLNVYSEPGKGTEFIIILPI